MLALEYANEDCETIILYHMAGINPSEIASIK